MNWNNDSNIVKNDISILSIECDEEIEKEEGRKKASRVKNY